MDLFTRHVINGFHRHAVKREGYTGRMHFLYQDTHVAPIYPPEAKEKLGYYASPHPFKTGG